MQIIISNARAKIAMEFQIKICELFIFKSKSMFIANVIVLITHVLQHAKRQKIKK